RGKLEPHGVTLEALEAGAVRNPMAAPVLFADRRFPTPSGKVNLMTEAPPEPGPTNGYRLSLMSISTDRAQSSQGSASLDGAAVATVHPDAALGIPDGALCRLESSRGSMTVRLRHDRRQRSDVVLTPKGGHLYDGRCANVLLTARTTDLGEGGALYDERVRIA